jgi:hypothetical protein
MIERTTRNELSSGFRNRPLGHCHFRPIEILKSRNLTSLVWIVSEFQDLESGPGVRTYQKQGNLSFFSLPVAPFCALVWFFRSRRSLRALRFRVLVLHYSGWSDIVIIFSWALARFWYNTWWISSHFGSLLSDRSGSGSLWWWLQRAWLFRLFPPQSAERKVQLARFYPLVCCCLWRMMLCCGCRFRSLVAALCVGSFLEAWCALFWGSQMDFFSVCCFVVFSSQIFSSVVSMRSFFLPSLWAMCRSFYLCRSEQTVLPTRGSWSLLVLVLRFLFACYSVTSFSWMEKSWLFANVDVALGSSLSLAEDWLE